MTRRVRYRQILVVLLSSAAYLSLAGNALGPFPKSERRSSLLKGRITAGIMLKSRFLPIATCGLGLLLLISSSGWFGKAEKDDPEEIKIDMGEQASTAPEPGLIQPPAASPQPITPQNDAGPLQVGAKYSFVKSIEQRVVQQQPGTPIVTHSRLTIPFVLEIRNVIGEDVLSVEGHNPGDALFEIKYDNFQYTQELPGAAVVYDSARPNGPAPTAIEAYRGLPGNGFSFWVDRRNHLKGLVGFTEFLERCLRQSTPQQRALIWKSFAGSSDNDHLANFVDDSIALPALEGGQQGQTWQKEQQIRQPIPVQLRLQYTVSETSQSLVEVTVGGVVVPQAAINLGGAQVEIQGGRINGRYQIDRGTGLPNHSRLEQTIEMVVQTPGGESIAQSKQTVTQLTASPRTQSSPQTTPYAGVEKSTVIR